MFYVFRSQKRSLITKGLFLFLALLLLQQGCSWTSHFALFSPKKLTGSMSENNNGGFTQKSLDFNLVENATSFSLGAELFKPTCPLSPPTVVIIPPGSGNISRFGEVFNDGLKPYEEPKNQVEILAQHLASNGVLVISYDKRTCQKSHNPKCFSQPSEISNVADIELFAHDLDGVFYQVRQKLQTVTQNFRIFLLGFNQAAQTIALSESAALAQGVFLLSPTLGDLGKTWVSGLLQAAEEEQDDYKRGFILGKAESTRSFFESLENDKFPSLASVNGAPVSFWHSWVSSSKMTIPLLEKKAQKTVIFFSHNDMFANLTEADNKSSTNIEVVTLESQDRNFVDHEGVNELVEKILQKIKNL